MVYVAYLIAAWLFATALGTVFMIAMCRAGRRADDWADDVLATLPQEPTVSVIERVREMEAPAAQFQRRMERIAEAQDSVPCCDQDDKDFYLMYGGG